MSECGKRHRNTILPNVGDKGPIGADMGSIAGHECPSTIAREQARSAMTVTRSVLSAMVGATVYLLKCRQAENAETNPESLGVQRGPPGPAITGEMPRH